MGVPMNESDRRQRVISSTPRLSAEEIANRTFAKGVRGFSETEVRARRSASRTRSRWDAVTSRTSSRRSTRSRSRSVRQGCSPSRSCSTRRRRDRPFVAVRARGQRRIRKKAEQRAADWSRSRPSRPSRLEPKRRSYWQRASLKRRPRRPTSSPARKARATAALDAAKAEAEAIVDSAGIRAARCSRRQRSRRAVLGDLVRRRGRLSAEIEALRGGRDHLLDADPNGQADLPRRDGSADAGRGARRGGAIGSEQ